MIWFGPYSVCYISVSHHNQHNSYAGSKWVGIAFSRIEDKNIYLNARNDMSVNFNFNLDSDVAVTGAVTRQVEMMNQTDRFNILVLSRL